MSQQVNPALEPQVRVEVRSNPLFLAGVREMVASTAKRLGFLDEVAGQMALAVDEALCNVIRHGYNRATDRPIWLSVWAEGGAWGDGKNGKNGGPAPEQVSEPWPETLRIVIEDEARQVDPSVIKSRDLEDVRPGGLGVHIIQTVMDEVVYEKRGKVGMRLTMVKRRTTGASGADLAAGACGCLEGRGQSVCGGTDQDQKKGHRHG